MGRLTDGCGSRLDDGHDAEKYSVVMARWVGDCDALDQAARESFGREGLDCVGLAVFGDRHLPAELCRDLRLADAERAALILRAAGACVDVVRTDELGHVRRRADEVWADKCSHGLCFSEVDGLILAIGALSARANAERLRQRGVFGWEAERSINHRHLAGIGRPGLDGPAQERETVSMLREALSSVYPDRSFTIEYSPGDILTFWQTPPGSAGQLDRRSV